MSLFCMGRISGMGTVPVRVWIWQGGRCLLVALALLVVSGCNGAEARREPPQVSIHLQAAPGTPSVHLRVPYGYVNDLVGWWEPHMPKASTTLVAPAPQTEELLFMTWPEMGPKTVENAKRFSDPLASDLLVLVKALDTSKAGLSEFLQRRLVLYKDSDSISRPYLMTAYPERFGLAVEGMLRSMQGEPVPMGGVREFDQFMRPLDAELAKDLFITCTSEDVPEPEDAPKSHRVPLCAMHFANQTLHAIVDVGFRRKHLSEWRDIHQRVGALLNSFVIPPSTSIQP